jgi:hypothetical protein
MVIRASNKFSLGRFTKAVALYVDLNEGQSTARAMWWWHFSLPDGIEHDIPF